jgi:SAM-dependent methyltransferase
MSAARRLARYRTCFLSPPVTIIGPPVFSYEQVNKLQTNSEDNPLTPARYRQFARHFPPKTETVLDVGCNNGRGGVVIKQLLGQNAKLFGVECVQERIDQIPAGVYEKVFYGLADDIPLEDNSLDVVLAGEIIEHVLPREVDAVIFELFRVLKLGGRLLMTTPNPGYLRNRIMGRSVLGDIGHVSQHHPRAMKLRLLLAGFSRVKLRGSGRAKNYIGERFPFLFPYGIYLVSADKE